MSTTIVAIPVPTKDQLAAPVPAAVVAPAEVAMKHVKVSLNDDTRRFSVIPDATKYAQLCKNVCQVYALPANAALLFKYRDEEGDVISVSSETELTEAFRVAGAAPLRLAVTVSAAPVVAAAAPKAAAPKLKAVALNTCNEPVLTVGPMMRLAPATPAPASANPQVAVLKERNQALKERLEQFKSRMADLKAARAAGVLQVQTLQRDLQYVRAEKNPKCKAVLALGRFVCDVSVPDGTVLTPGELVTKTWRFRNDANEAWPAGTRLLFVGKNSDRMGAPDEVLVQREVLPGAEIDISVPLTAPNAPGRYVTYFRLCGPNERKFGQRVWCSVIVKEAGSSSDEESSANAAAPADTDMIKYQHQLQVLAEMNLTNLRLNIRLLNKFDGNLEVVVERMFARRAKFAARCAANPKACDKAAHRLAKMEEKVERKAAKLEERLAAKVEKVAAKTEKAEKSDSRNN